MNVRRAAWETLFSVTEDGAYANLALKEAAKTVSENDIPKLYSLVYTALEQRSYTEYILSHYCKRQKKAIRNVLLLGASELLFSKTPAHAVIYETVALAKAIGKRDGAGLVNAVLRRVDRERDALPSLPADPLERLVIRYGYPYWVVSEWVDAYGVENAEKLLQTPPSAMQVRAQYPLTTESLKTMLPCQAISGRIDPNCLHLSQGFDIEKSDLYRDGSLAVQNEGAMMIVRALGDVRGKTVLDACAAPGGKSAYLYSLFEGNVNITAWELHPHRRELMNHSFSRLRVQAHTECRDASRFDAAYRDLFDAVLLDVPCSGLGLLADKPDLRYRITQDSINGIVDTQKAILEACSQYVKPGGKLVYATCTISKRENEQQVGAFLEKHKAFTLLSEKQYLPFRDGIDGFYHATMKRGIK